MDPCQSFQVSSHRSKNWWVWSSFKCHDHMFIGCVFSLLYVCQPLLGLWRMYVKGIYIYIYLFTFLWCACTTVQLRFILFLYINFGEMMFLPFLFKQWGNPQFYPNKIWDVSYCAFSKSEHSWRWGGCGNQHDMVSNLTNTPNVRSPIWSKNIPTYPLPSRNHSSK